MARTKRTPKNTESVRELLLRKWQEAADRWPPFEGQPSYHARQVEQIRAGEPVHFSGWYLPRHLRDQLGLETHKHYTVDADEVITPAVIDRAGLEGPEAHSRRTSRRPTGPREQGENDG